MQAPNRDDIEALDEAFEANARDASALVLGLTETFGTWRADPGSWSVAECLDHMAAGNQVYLRAMEPAAERARTQGRRHRRPARPGVVGGWFVRLMEPPVKPRLKMKAPGNIRPRRGPSLGDAIQRFFVSHADARTFLRSYAEIDLAGVRFVNPLVSGIRFSLATGLHVLVAHERRHLWQAWRVRRAAESSAASPVVDVR